MALIKFTIPFTLPSLNDYTKANRTHHRKGNKLKQRTQRDISYYLPKVEIKKPVTIKITWHEKNKRRDPDNVIFAKKFILDAMVNADVLVDDSQKWVKGFEEVVKVDQKCPRVEVEIKGDNE